MKLVLILELKKLRRRYIPAMYLACLILMAAWMWWVVRDLNPSSLNDPAAMLYLNLLLMNAILCPIVLAAAASRMCDIEQQGNTWKWLCTLQKPEQIYLGKSAAGLLFLAVFCLLQAVFYYIFCGCEDISAPTRAIRLLISLFLPSMVLFMLQLNLSLSFVNQLTPIFLCIGGTFAGLFSWFLPQLPLRYLIPWGYYAALCSTGYIYNETIGYTTYFWYPLPILPCILCLTVGILLYWLGRNQFLNNIRKTI